ncbi:MAG: efflux RND transporter permease subunit [Clostridiales bacterium]|nr:efflux RND transporter permease subunit [Clostridiales bacterium]
MKKFFSTIIKQKVAIILAVVFIIAFGIFSTLQMPINLLPDINVPMVCVQIIYPGANASSVEKDVTKKVEDGLSSISGVTGVNSYSYDNLSAVVLSFDYGTDTNGKKSDISSKLDGLDLPDGITRSVYDIDLNAEALAVLSITSSEGGGDEEKLKNAYLSAEELASKIRAIDGVESVELKGGAQTSYVIRPYGGLELIAPLIVQAFSYGELDIPLGNISSSGGNIQIRNNSDIKSEDDIKNMPVALPSSIVTLLTSVKSIMRYYENSTAGELQTLSDDLDGGVLDVLQQIGEMTADDLGRIAELRTYMNIAENFTADQLTYFKTSRFYNDIYEAVTNAPEEEDGERTPKTNEELQDIVEELKDRYPLFSQYLTVDMLKIVSENKLGEIIAFREWLEQTEEYRTANANGEYYGFIDRDYVKLARDMGVYGEEVGDDEILKEVDFAKKTSAAGLTQIADKKRDAEEKGEEYDPTDGECALLFTGTELSAEHPIIMSPTFIAFVRSPNYAGNMETLADMRGEDEELSSEQFYEIYSNLDLSGVFGFKLSEELFGFILNSDFTNLNPNGEFVTRVTDIAEIGKEDEFTSYVYFGNGKAEIIKGVILEVYKSNGANSSAVVEEVKSIYSSFLKQEEVSGTAIKLLDDQSEFISDSISNVLISMLIGGALAVLVIFVFLKKVRTSLIIAITMPLSVLASLICLYLMGITLNMVSLGGLAVGIGMLVDNSIVVIESITKHRECDKTPFDAAVDGTVEVGGALFGSTLTTVCVFIPIIFSGGLTGEIFTDLSWAVIFSLAFSLIVSVTVIPTLYALVCGNKKEMLKGGKLTKDLNAEAAEKPKEPDKEAQSAEQEEATKTEQSAKKVRKPSRAKNFFRGLKEPKVMGAVTGFYGKILPKLLNKKLITILVAVAVFGASIGLLFLTGTEFLPSIDKGQIEIDLSYDGKGKQLDEIQTDVKDFADAVCKNIDNVEYVSISVGKNGLLALTDTGIIKVQLKTDKDTQKTVEKIRALSKDEKLKPQGDVTVREIDGVVASLMSGATDMAVTVVGNDSDTLAKIADEIAGKLENNGFESVTKSVDSKATEYDITFDRMKMAELGLDYQTTVLTLRIGIASYTACRVTIDGEEYNLNVRFEKGTVASEEDLKNFVVGADSSGNAVKLEDIISEFKEISTATCIRRTDGKQMVSVSGVLPGVDTGTAGKKMQALAKEVLSKSEYAGYTFEESGITSYLNDAFSGLVVALVISFFLLYAVMAVQFGSFVKPLIIMASIPFSFTGGFIALVITGTSLNVVSFIGLIMLMGVVVNNAIVMLEKIKQLHEDGMNHYDAVREACKTRLRPILMTTLTTILALIPLAIGVGKGSELMQPLGIVVIGGLLIGTLVTLVLVPTVYCAVHRLSGKKKEPKQKVKAENK